MAKLKIASKAPRNGQRASETIEVYLGAFSLKSLQRGLQAVLRAF